MDKITDPRVCFFLEHQERIQEWANLRKIVNEKAREFLKEFATDLNGHVITGEEGVRVHAQLTGKWPGAFLYREAWTNQIDTPRVGIGIEWERNKVVFGIDNSAYVGVRVENTIDGWKVLAASLHEEIGKVIKKTEFKRGGANSIWPAIKYETPSNEKYWENLSSYHSQLEDRIEDAWKLFAPIVDRAVN